MARFIPLEASGITPQRVTLTRVCIDPVTVLNPRPGAETTALLDNDSNFACFPGAPLFTTAAAMARAAAPGSRGGGDEYLMPVIFNVPDGARAGPGDQFIFVGIAYGAGSKKQPVVSAGTDGLVSIPRTGAEAERRLVGKKVWWERSDIGYGSASGPTVAVPVAYDNRNGGLFRDDKAACGLRIIGVHPHSFSILLGGVV